ncbi:MAG: NAD-dependent epimerase/dehydratase family protein [Bacillota bacterium]
METVLVMGGSYFIGKHVVNALKETYKVTVLNRGNNPLNDPLVKELICDRNKQDKIEDLLQGETFDYVVDISCFTPKQAEILVSSLHLPSLKKYVFISTSAVYDIKEPVPYDETVSLLGESPFKDYAVNKIACEAYFQSIFTDDQLIIYRPPYVYGEDNYILRERLLFHLLENEMPIYIPKTNNQAQFVYVKDLAMYTEKALDNTIPGGVYNVGLSTHETFTSWVDACSKIVGKKAHKVIVDQNDTDVNLNHVFPFFAIDIVLKPDKIKQFVKKDTPFEKGLIAAYDDYKKIRDTISLPERMVIARDKLYQKVHK